MWLELQFAKQLHIITNFLYGVEKKPLKNETWEMDEFTLWCTYQCAAGIGVQGQCTSIYELEITQITDLWLIK